MFKQFKNVCKFEDELGLVYGRIVIKDDLQSETIVSLEVGRYWLKSWIKKNLLTSDEAAKEDKAMAEAGVLDADGVVSRILAAVDPSAGTNGLSFVLCDGRGGKCVIGKHLAHGFVCNVDGERISMPIGLHADAFDIVHQAFIRGLCTVKQAANLFEEIVDAGILKNAEEAQARLDCLPADVKRELDYKTRGIVLREVLRLLGIE